MFASAIQPGIVSLFSSTGTDPLSLFSAQTDSLLPSDSLIHLLHDATSSPEPPAPATIIHPPDSQSYSLDQTVLHIQSPTLPSTFIRCPPSKLDDARNRNFESTREDNLGIKHPWIHIQARNLGREWSFEVGIADQSGRIGVIRCSTFQKDPRLKLPSDSTSAPILHLPLSFPPPSSRPLTAWSTINLHLPQFLPHFSSLAREEDSPNSRYATLPGGAYSHISYVKVYATCRLRRIWFSEAGPSQRLPWEFELYGVE